MPVRIFLAIFLAVSGAATMLVSGHPARAQAPQSLDAALLDSEIAAVRSEMDVVTARLAALETRYGELPWTRDRTDDFVTLGREVDGLRERVVALGARLNALNAANKSVETIVAVSPLRAALNDYGGAPIPPTVAEGAILAFETTVRHAASDIPQIANLSWRVIDSAGVAVPDFAKNEQVAEAGTTKPYRFRFRLGSHPNGPYRVVFTHAPATGGAAPISVESGFTVSQSVRITRAVVSPDTTAEKHSSVLYPEQVPHLYVYFDAGQSKSVSVDFAVRSAKDGREHHRQQVERPIKPGEAETRVGLRIQPGRVREGEDAVFVATLTGPDGFVVTRETKFSVQAYTATLNLPSQLKSLDPVTFSIGVPAQFSAPLQIQLSPSNVTASLTGGNTGILSAAGNQSGGSGNLNVTVTDAQGRVARGSAYFTITPPPAVAAAPPPGNSTQPARSPSAGCGVEGRIYVDTSPSNNTPIRFSSCGSYQYAAQVCGRTVYGTQPGGGGGGGGGFMSDIAVQLRRSDGSILARCTLGDIKAGTAAVTPAPAPPPAPAGPSSQDVIQDALADFQRQMAQIQADKQNAEHERNLRNQQEMQKLQAQLRQQQQRAVPSTIYWVVYTEDVCGAVGCPSVSTTSGPRPPPTGFSNPNPASPGNYMRVTKAYGTLDLQEARRIEAGIRSRSLSTSNYFPITNRGSGGYQGAGHSGPLVRYGPGVQALIR